MEYHFKEIEAFWQRYWEENQIFKTETTSKKPKYYVLDMFPYPSGAGLHVGHPLGYIASDIYARYKRLQAYNVLHPIGYDAFGLPAEQYAIQTGQHPAVTTNSNIENYTRQLKRMGFSFDWQRVFRTSDAGYYKWTQWIFLKLFNAWYNKTNDRAEPIESLIKHFETSGTEGVFASTHHVEHFSSEQWKAYTDQQKQTVLLNYRLAFRSENTVNWCPDLGTVLANDEVKDGKSERGGFEVFQKKMMQWSLRITAYAERLLNGLDALDWPTSTKESQRHWIGKSMGVILPFTLKESNKEITVFTTRIDTIFGVGFLVLAPEHPLVDEITTNAHKTEVQDYVQKVLQRSSIERQADKNTPTGVFTGAYALHPFTKQVLPVYIADYVLMDYGTGAVMAVAAHDKRDHAFARQMNLPIIPVISGSKDTQNEAFESKSGRLIHSEKWTGLSVEEAQKSLVETIVSNKLGRLTTNYRMRDAVFSRQRYWGEPFPIYYKDGLPYALDISLLPLKLPNVDKYLPTEQGDPPLGRATHWAYDVENKKVVSNQKIDHKTIFPLETNTMPGWAASSWYYLRYMDLNDDAIASEKALGYWKNVDLYIGGSEHATGHLLYARFWHKFLKDMGYLQEEEPFKRLVNQGMILGVSAFVYRIKDTNTFVTLSLKDNYDTTALHVDISLLKQGDELDIEAFKKWRSDFADAQFITEASGAYITGRSVEKMSKSKYNVINPDEVISKYGADTLRLYEMFLGPLEQSKPWNTQGISGVYSFLKKLWRLFHQNGTFFVDDAHATPQELKILHGLIQKIKSDLETLSLNTSVSSFMIAVNELSKLKTQKRSILEPFIILLSSYAPHISEELWCKMGNETSVSKAIFPTFNPDYLVEDTYDYPIMINGKRRFNMELSLSLTSKQVEDVVLESSLLKKHLPDNQKPKKIIVVAGKVINLVI